MKEQYIVVDSLSELTKDKIGEGQCGICYKVGDRVFKKLKEVPLFLGTLKSLQTLKSKNFTFPQEFVYLKSFNNNNFQGYFREYVDGCTIDKIDDLYNIRDYIRKLNEFEEEIRRLTEEKGFVLRDAHDENIMFSSKEDFVMADIDLCYLDYTADFCYLGYMEPYTLYKQNMKELGNAVLPMFLSNVVNENIEYLYHLCVFNAKAKPSIVLSETLKELEKSNKKRILTLHDFKEGLDLIR